MTNYSPQHLRHFVVLEILLVIILVSVLAISKTTVDSSLVHRLVVAVFHLIFLFYVLTKGKGMAQHFEEGEENRLKSENFWGLKLAQVWLLEILTASAILLVAPLDSDRTISNLILLMQLVKLSRPELWVS